MIQVNLTRFPRAVDALARTRRYFLGHVHDPAGAAAGIAAVTRLAPDLRDTAPADMIEVAREHLRLQRDIHLDFIRASVDLSDHDVALLARLAGASASRESASLQGLSEPDWFVVSTAHLSMLPTALIDAVAVLQELDATLARMSADAELREAALALARDRMRLTRAATQVLAVEEQRERLMASVDAVYATAARSRRALNRADQRCLEGLRGRLAALNADEQLASVQPAELGALTDELNRLVRRRNRRELDRGLLLTPQMRTVLSKALPILSQGRPVLLVGETGGAKTALARELAGRTSKAPAELVSFHGEINTYQLIGRDRIESDGGMSFRQGPVLRAITRGAPLILDEVNAAPAEFLKRLNVIMQLRPGDSFLVQEDSDSHVAVREGFCIIATANEKSTRYKGVEVLSAELKNRFGTNVYRIGYPDQDVVVGELPSEGLALAEAALADELGEFPVELSQGQLVALVKAAHATQKLFTGDYGDERADDLIRGFIPIDRMVDGANAPALEDSVLSPRMVVSILQQVREGMGRVKLTELLRDWVVGIEKHRDREVLMRLLESFVTDDGVTLLGNTAWSSEPASV